MDTGVSCYDSGQSKPKMSQDLTGVITGGFLATKRQINKLCYKFFITLNNSDFICKFFIVTKMDDWK